MRGGDITGVPAQSGNTQIDVPPEITLQPQAVVVRTGGTATFTIGVEGSDPLTFQWYVAGVG